MPLRPRCSCMLPATRAIVIICAIVCAFSISKAATVTHTTVVLVSPWSPNGLRSGFTVSAKVKGSCWTHSLASERPDAWRCADYDHGIYDPCFSGSLYKKTLACAEGPFLKGVVLMTVAKPLNDNMKLTGELWGLRLRGAPWGLRLVNGDTCVFVSGATAVFEGERLNYPCAGKTGWIFGSPNRSSAVWTARSVHWPDGGRPSGHVTQVGIATAVF